MKFTQNTSYTYTLDDWDWPVEQEREWEMFQDDSYFDLWCVRDIEDREFNSPTSYHFEDKSDAEEFLRLVRKAK